MFSVGQIQEILNIIEFQSNFFIAGNISNKILSKEDKLFLEKLNIDFETQFKDFTPFQQAFYFGRLVSMSEKSDLQNPLSSVSFENNLLSPG